MPCGTKMVDESAIQAKIIPLIADLVPDFNLMGLFGEINERTRLIADLDLTSIDFIDLFVAIEKSFGESIGFHDLIMVDGRYISDLSVGQLSHYILNRITHQDFGYRKKNQHAGNLPQGTTLKLNDNLIQRFQDIIPRPPEHLLVGKKNKPLVFLLSASRSGSTLLQAILAGHPELFAPPELHLLWFEDLFQRRQVYQLETNRHLLSGAIRAIMELDCLNVSQAMHFLEKRETERMLVHEFYAYMQSRLGKRMLVDKTPSYSYSLDVLKRAELDFEDPFYIFLVRHPCGMKRSFIESKLERTVPFMMRAETEFSREQFAELAWLICNQNVLRFLENIPENRQYTLRYEDLVKNPSNSIKHLCDFLCISYHPNMLDPYQDKKSRMTDGLSTTSQMSGDLKFHLHSRIEPDAADRWKNYMSEEELGIQTKLVAEFFGYGMK